ncbi:MAG: hypothetical protein ACKVOW_21160 [Chitinophagaceae bacterium]
MKKLFLLLILSGLFLVKGFGQSVGIGTNIPDNSAILDVKSGTKGMLIPRTNPAGRNAISNPAKGLLVYDTTDNFLWYYNGAGWNTVGSGFQLPFAANTSINTGNAVFSIINNGSTTPVYAENTNPGAIGVQSFGGLRGVDAFSWNGTGSRSSIGVFGSYYGGPFGAPTVGGVGVMGIGLGGGFPSLTLNNKHFGMYAQASDYGIYAKAPFNTGVAALFFGQTWMQGSQHYSHFNFGVNEDTYIRAGKDNSLIVIGDGTGQRVAIGSTTVASGFSLSVSGKVITEEVQIQLKTAWPDYVFSNHYRLTTLEELECFISQHRHLPNIPTAAEIEKDGLQVGDLQKRMMEKIEELTLYLIGLKKENEQLKNRVEQLEKNN